MGVLWSPKRRLQELSFLVFTLTISVTRSTLCQEKNPFDSALVRFLCISMISLLNFKGILKILF